MRLLVTHVISVLLRTPCKKVKIVKVTSAVEPFWGSALRVEAVFQNFSETTMSKVQPNTIINLSSFRWYLTPFGA